MRKIIYIGILYCFTINLQAQDGLKKNEPKTVKPLSQIGLEQITEEGINKQIIFLKSSALMKEDNLLLINPQRIKEIFRYYQLKPIEKNNFLQKFSVIKYRSTNNQKLIITSLKHTNLSQKLHFQYKTDFYFTPPSIDQHLKTQIVFVGYGLQYAMLAYNDFKGVDIRNKIILRIKGFPGHRDTISTAYKAFRWADLKKLEISKDLIAKKLGAVGIIDIDIEKDNGLDWVHPTASTWKKNTLHDSDNLEIQPLQIKISKRLFKKLIQINGINVKKFEEDVSKNLSILNAKILDKTPIEIETSVISKRIEIQNIIGVIQGKNKNENIVINANYYGFNEKNIKKNIISNASMLTIIQVLKNLKIQPKKNIIFLSSAGGKKQFGAEYFSSQYSQKINKWIHYKDYLKEKKENIKIIKSITKKIFLEIWQQAYEEYKK